MDLLHNVLDNPKKEGNLLVFYGSSTNGNREWRKVTVSVNKYGLKFYDIKEQNLLGQLNVVDMSEVQTDPEPEIKAQLAITDIPCFEVKSSKNSFVFCASSAKERDEWCRAMLAAKRALQSKLTELGNRFEKEKFETMRTASSPSLTTEKKPPPLVNKNSLRLNGAEWSLGMLRKNAKMSVGGEIGKFLKNASSDAIPAGIATDSYQGYAKFKYSIDAEWVTKYFICKKSDLRVYTREDAPGNFPEESIQISAFIVNKDTIARFTQRRICFILVSQKAMWLVGYEDEKEFKSWKAVFTNANIPERESIEFPEALKNFTNKGTASTKLIPLSAAVSPSSV